MAIYDINGVESSGYDISGNVLNDAFDINGNALNSEGYPISNVVSYFRSPTVSVKNEVNALSSDWQSFVFITDPHGSGNKNHSQSIALYLLNNAKVDFILLCGDYSVGNWDKTQYDAWVAPFLESDNMNNIYALFGNHEMMGNGRTEAMACIYSDFLDDKTNIQGNPSNNYYYFDNTSKKTRYVCLNTSDGSTMYTMSATQIAWISSVVTLPSTDWHLVVCGHVNICDFNGLTYSNESNGADIVTAISGSNGNIVGYVCGHQHIDQLYNDGNFEHVTLICDKFENTNYYNGVSVTDRVEGTVSEQGVSVISFNTKTKNVIIRRIGAHRYDSLAYSY